MEQIFSYKKKKYMGVMLNHGKFYAVIDCEDKADTRITYVACPFNSNKLRFVDMLDHRLKEAGLKGVRSYTRDDVLTFVFIDEDGTDLQRLLPIVDDAMQKLDELRCDDVSETEARLMREFLLYTWPHWITKEKYDLLNCISNEIKQDGRH